jgi:hypothetical protein
VKNYSSAKKIAQNFQKGANSGKSFPSLSKGYFKLKILGKIFFTENIILK